MNDAYCHETDNHGVITRGELILSMIHEITRMGVGEWYQVPANVEQSASFEVATDESEFWLCEQFMAAAGSCQSDETTRV